jgi:hypothetical protein
MQQYLDCQRVENATTAGKGSQQKMPSIATATSSDERLVSTASYFLLQLP